MPDLHPDDFPCWFRLTVVLQGGTHAETWYVEDEADLADFQRECGAIVAQHIRDAAAHGPYSLELSRSKDNTGGEAGQQ